MPMVSLAGLVVIAQNTMTADDMGQAILERMGTAGHRLWQLPDDDLSKGVLGENDTPLYKTQGIHRFIIPPIVVKHTNMLLSIIRNLTVDYRGASLHPFSQASWTDAGLQAKKRTSLHQSSRELCEFALNCRGICQRLTTTSCAGIPVDRTIVSISTVTSTATPHLPG